MPLYSAQIRLASKLKLPQQLWIYEVFCAFRLATCENNPILHQPAQPASKHFVISAIEQFPKFQRANYISLSNYPQCYDLALPKRILFRDSTH